MDLTWRLVTANDPGSTLIQWMSAGRASHIGLMLPGDFELGARFDKVGGKPPGVQIRPADYASFASQTYLHLTVPDDKGKACIDFELAQIGKPYDWRAIVGFAVNRDWRSQGAWICSELVAAALEHAGICHKLFLTADKITPVAAGLILTALGATVQ